MAEPRQTGHSLSRVALKRRFVFAILIFGILILGLLWGAIVWRLAVERDAEWDDSALAARNLAESLEQHTLRRIHQVDLVTRFIKYEFERDPSHFDLKQVMASGVASDRTSVLVSVIDRHGDLIATTGTGRGRVNLSDREHFRVHVNDPSDALFISRPVLGRVSHQWTVQMTRRLNAPDGSFAGVVVVSKDPAYLAGGFYNVTALGRQGAICIVSDDGTLLARSTATAITTSGASSPMLRMPALPPTPVVAKDPIDGVMRILAARHLEGYPLRVQVGLARDEQFADYFHLRHVYLIMAAIISVALMAFLAAMTYLLLHLVRYSREVTHIAERDGLTGLPNRYLLMQTLKKAVADDVTVGRLALLYIDLDNFKGINDTLGHDVGDDVLCQVSRRFAGVLAPDDMLARLSGDEFVVVTRGDQVWRDAEQLAQRLIEALREPFDAAGNNFLLHVSIGIAFHSDRRENENDLLKKADLAMYGAKDSGKSCFKAFAPEMLYHANQLMMWERLIDDALARGEFFMSYQPIVHLGPGPDRIVGFEALIRWRHPERGVIAAGEFIPIAETTGQIVRIGEFALTSACRQLAQWQAELAMPLRLSVNVSSVQFWRTNMYDVVRRCLDDYGVAPQGLELEMTESVMIRNPASVEAAIEQLKSLGVRIALDDFGTGYSSLAYLSRFPVDTLKVDRSFVVDVPGSHKACLMVSNIVSIAQVLGVGLVIEGVENSAQLEWLRQFAAVRVQGFLLSPPVPADQVPALIARFGTHAGPVGAAASAHPP